MAEDLRIVLAFHLQICSEVARQRRRRATATDPDLIRMFAWIEQEYDKSDKRLRAARLAAQEEACWFKSLSFYMWNDDES